MIPALSIRQPWAWLIVNGHKDIENRDWSTPFRGRFLVHAGQTLTRPQYEDVVTQLLLAGIQISLPPFEDLREQCGGFVGWSRVVDCVREHPSGWKEPGSYGFVLADSMPIPFVPYKGRLGWFNAPSDLIKP
ncbi:ASCH domain-containing protein [Hydrogenophaga sp. NH-16]|uniref:ASCH domain-containing protein n=1 Tax=Hydrogenophaga sp. NH-16 TaxID=2184519 RepID=UPI001F4ED734|nr:ASCH domain-containing protein [Hydrogenophaga sp. NH-16]